MSSKHSSGRVGLGRPLRMIADWLGTHKRQLLIAFCLALVAVRLRWPDIKVDGVTVWLVVVAVLLFLLPEVRAFLPYVERAKLGPVELTLREGIRALTREIEEAQDSYAEEGRVIDRADIGPDVEQVITEARRDPRSSLLWLSSKVETEIRRVLESVEAPEHRRYMPLRRAVELGVEAGVLPRGALPAFQDFWAMRNRIVHDFAFDVPDSTVLSLISLGTELLKMLATTRADE